jgi:hypothetical protein
MKTTIHAWAVAMSIIFCTVISLFAQTNAAKTPRQNAESEGYRIEQPGTITFTQGITIKGKVEKPQVMIFLPKEKTLFKEITFNRSFRDAIALPPVFDPIID